MRKSLFPIIAVLGLMFMGAACTVEELAPEQNGDESGLVHNGKTVTISAKLEQPDTKTAFGESNSVCWSANDQIRIFNASTPEGEVFMLTSGAGSTSAVFSGDALSGDGPFYAVYPASAGVSLTDGSVSVTVPSTQTYAAGSFGNGFNISVSKADKLEDFSFKNVGGVICFSLKGQTNVKSINLYTKGEELLNGSASISFSGETPSMSWATVQSGDALQMVSLDCGRTGVELDATDETPFYMVLPAGALSAGFTIEVIDTEGKAMVKNVAGNSAQIVRSSIRPMPAFTYAASYEASFLLSTAPAGAFSGILAESGSFTVGCTYSEESGQYAYKNVATGDSPSRYVRIQDWSAGFALGLTAPYTLSAGTKASVKVESLGATGVSSSDATEMKVLKKVGNRVWLADTTNGYGFIMMMVED